MLFTNRILVASTILVFALSVVACQDPASSDEQGSATSEELDKKPEPREPKSIPEGIIEYKLTYKQAVDDYMEDMIPKTMKFIFKGNMMYLELVAGLGFVKVGMISHNNDPSLTHMLNFMGHKYKVPMDEAEAMETRNTYPEYNIRETEETKEIAGLLCKKAEVSLVSNPDSIFDIYYTNEIKLDRPNWFNTFDGIDGVLMQYPMKQFGFSVDIVADTIITDSVAQHFFDYPSAEDYQEISYKEYERRLNEFATSN